MISVFTRMSNVSVGLREYRLMAPAIDAFLLCHAPEIELLHKGKQVAIRKRKAGEDATARPASAPESE